MSYYTSQYYTCPEIDERLLKGYYDDVVELGYTGTFEQFKLALANIGAFIATVTEPSEGVFVCDKTAIEIGTAILANGRIGIIRRGVNVYYVYNINTGSTPRQSWVEGLRMYNNGYTEYLEILRVGGEVGNEVTVFTKRIEANGIISLDSSQIHIESMIPNVMYTFVEPIDELHIEGLASLSIDSNVNEYMVEFTASQSWEQEEPIFPDTVKWANELYITPGNTYQISIVNNIGIFLEVENE